MVIRMLCAKSIRLIHKIVVSDQILCANKYNLYFPWSTLVRDAAYQQLRSVAIPSFLNFSACSNIMADKGLTTAAILPFIPVTYMHIS